MQSGSEDQPVRLLRYKSNARRATPRAEKFRFIMIALTEKHSGFPIPIQSNRGGTQNEK